ncbi:MAG TPA: D-2-hydroxyacid dehydrogenase [Chloroflexota bacterium]|nr:D-2-hydroxyacid dehydrogenase [Chloroflexota bacterium]
MVKLLLYGREFGTWVPALQQMAPGVTIETATDPADGQAKIADADAFFGVITPELLAAARQLRWIQTPMAGLERYFFPALVEHPVTVTNMRGIYHDMIPDHVLCYILCFARDMHTQIRLQLERRWAPREVKVVHLPGATLGIVGLGGIGYGVAQRAAPHGMRIIAVDPRVESKPPELDQLWPPDRLDDLLAEADFVTVCAPETPETRGLFDASKFAKMKPTAIFINVGRGRVVKLDAVTEALQQGRIAGAALDVFEQEPLPSDHPLWGMDNVIITPHTAGFSAHQEDRRLEVLGENLRRFVAGEPLHNVVDKARGY